MHGSRELLDGEGQPVERGDHPIVQVDSPVPDTREALHDPDHDRRGHRLVHRLGHDRAAFGRLQAEGPTQKEIDQTLQQMRIDASLGEIGGQSRPTPALADEIVEAKVAGLVVEEPAKRLATLELSVGSATPADVKEALAHDWSGSGPLLAVIAPGGADKVRAAVEEAGYSLAG